MVGSPAMANASPRMVLLTLWLLVFSSASQIMIIGPILPRIGEELGVETSLLGMLMTAYAVALALFALLTGPISDRVGRRRVLLVGSSMMSLALLFHALATDFPSLLVLRALAGAAGGVLSGASVAFIGDYFPSDRRGWANGWIMSGLAAGQILAIPLGTLLAEHLGFRAPFLAFALTMMLTTFMVWRVIPRLAPASDVGLSVRGALAGYVGLLRQPSVAAASAAFVFIFLSISLFVVYLPAWLETSLGFASASIAGLYFLGGVANVLAGPRAGRLSDRIGRKRVIIASSFGIAVAMLATPFLASALWTVYGLFFTLMALFASRASPFQALLTELVASDQRGSLMSLTTAIGQVGFGLGGAVAGVSYASYGFFANAVLAAVSALATAILVWRYLPEPRLEEPSKPDPCAPLRTQDALCGPCPEAGHMPRDLQDACARRAASRIEGDDQLSPSNS